MILRPIEKYYTEEEKNRLDEIQHSALEIFVIDDDDWKDADADTLETLYKERETLEASAIIRYMKSFGKNLGQIYEDAQEIIDAVTKQDYLSTLDIRTETQRHFIDGLRKDYERGVLDEETLNSKLSDILYKTRDSIDGAAQFLMDVVWAQYFVARERGIESAPINRAIEKKLEEWYPEEEEPPDGSPVTPAKQAVDKAAISNTHYAIPYSHATGNLAFANTKKAQINRKGELELSAGEVEYTVEKFNEIRGTLGVSTDKLLKKALAEFGKQNDFSGSDTVSTHPHISIPLKEFAYQCGYEVEERPTSSPEEAKKEKRRAKSRLDKARKKIKEDMQTLYGLSIDSEERYYNPKTRKYETTRFSKLRIFEHVKLDGGVCYITFSQTMAEVLLKAVQIGQYNKRALAIDERRPNAYKIFVKMDEHYNIMQNIEKGTNDRLKVENLLKITDLPTYEEVQEKDRGHWEGRIKEPLEESLCYLTKEKYLKDWKYTHAKGKDLTDAEAANITSYKEYSELYIVFEPCDKLDHSEKIEKRKAHKSNSQKKKKKKA